MVTNHWVLKSSMSQVFHGAFKYSSQEILSELKVKLSSRLHIINVLPHLLLHGYWVLIYDVKSWRGDSNLMQSVIFLRLTSNISHQMSIFDLWHQILMFTLKNLQSTMNMLIPKVWHQASNIDAWRQIFECTPNIWLTTSKFDVCPKFEAPCRILKP